MGAPAEDGAKQHQPSKHSGTTIGSSTHAEQQEAIEQQLQNIRSSSNSFLQSQCGTKPSTGQFSE
eukprot:4286569-Amphidinium_carterae.1